jgi:hypothetical protein
MSRKKDAFRSPNWASVLDDDEVIVITVMGDGMAVHMLGGSWVGLFTRAVRCLDV